MNTNQYSTTWHTVAPTELGELTLVRDEQGITAVYFPHHWHQPAVSSFGPVADRGFDEVKAQLAQYLAGERREFTVPTSVTGHDLDLQVWDRIAQVGYGRTATYGELARHIGRGTTAQQIGGIVGRNSLCLLVPCHRIVGSGGKLTGYAGGLSRKKMLLDLEQDHSDQAGSGLFSSISTANAS